MRKIFLGLLLVLCMALSLSAGSVVIAVETPPPPASALTGLVLSGAPSGFTFAPDILTYNGLQVANSVASVTVTPTGEGTISVNGTEVVSGAASVEIPLTAGEEESISVVVTQTGMPSTTYTINVTRRSNIWATTPFTGGGTSGDPYIIDTAEELAYLAEQVNGGETYIGKYFEMTADIVLNDTSNWLTWDEDTVGLNEWTPIGDYENVKAFEGNFNGNGHVVKGIYISSESDYQGLFSYSGYGVVIENLGVAEGYIQGGDYVGGVVGGGINTTVQNCYNTAKITGGDYVGGIIGDNYLGTVKNSYNSGSVSGASYIGGVAGNNRSTVQNCYNSALITGGNYVGGIVGQNIIDSVNSSYGIVQNCYNSGDISGNGNVGGVAGKNENNMEYCYWLIAAEQTVDGTPRAPEDKRSIGYNDGLATDVFSFTEAQGQGTEPSTVIDSGGTYSNTTSLLGALIAYTTYEGNPGTWFAAPSLSVNGGYPILTGYSGGTGSEEDPYLISTADDLRQLALTVNCGETYTGKYFEMTTDITLNDTTNWQSWNEDTTGLNEWIPIGDDINEEYHVFKGIFDGGGHTVRGVYISEDESDYQGLFGFVYDGGIVKNLGVTQSFISGDEFVGGVAGHISTIEYCWFSGTVQGSSYVGGVVGYLDGTAQFCYNTGSVSGMFEVGGVFGIIGESTIGNCYNAGDVSGGYHIGGITSTHIESISDCYNSGVVTGLSIPELDDILDEWGMSGTSPLYIGAIIGEAQYPGQITGCCYDKQMSREAGVGGETESSDIAGTVGKLTTQMCDVTLDTDFGADGAWVFENGLYPRLTGMSATDAAIVSATPVRLQFMSPTEFEMSSAVERDFIVGTPSGVGWTSNNSSVIAINDGIADLTRQSIDTTVILTAAKNNVSKQVPLNILAALAAISPTNSNYDLSAPAEVTTTITWNRASSVTGVAYGTTPLAAPADYSISGNTLTIENGFIAGLSPALNDEINLVITFDTGDTSTLTVNVVDGFVAVTGITEVPTTVRAGTPLTLTGAVNPANATNQTIVWSVADAGTTGATITGNTLTTSAAGTAVVRATITNGLTASSDYTRDFSITVNSAGGGGSDTSNTTAKTITVTETSSEVFVDSAGTIKAEANMDNAFSNSVEVKVTDTAEDTANFKLSAGDEVYPFDISLYIKGTNTRTEPAPGYAVTISLPIPENLLNEKERLAVLHKSDSGAVTTLESRLEQLDGVWYLVFEAMDFSPYALVVRNSGSSDESAGVPYYMDAQGNKVFIGFAANDKYIAPEGVTISVMQNDKSFTDVAGHWAESYIGFTTEREIFFGTDGSNFSPEMGMTRAMFATVIGRLYERSFGEIAASSTHAFIDCDYGLYYGKYVDWAAENEIIGGIGSGKFAPDTMITREQMAAILYRFAGFLGVLPSGMDTAFEYPDAASISSYAQDAALYCQTTSIIEGRTGGVFAPQETATRAEVATIIQHFIETVMK